MSDSDAEFKIKEPERPFSRPRPVARRKPTAATIDNMRQESSLFGDSGGMDETLMMKPLKPIDRAESDHGKLKKDKSPISKIDKKLLKLKKKQEKLEEQKRLSEEKKLEKKRKSEEKLMLKKKRASNDKSLTVEIEDMNVIEMDSGKNVKSKSKHKNEESKKGNTKKVSEKESPKSRDKKDKLKDNKKTKSLAGLDETTEPFERDYETRKDVINLLDSFDGEPIKESKKDNKKKDRKQEPKKSAHLSKAKSVTVSSMQPPHGNHKKDRSSSRKTDRLITDVSCSIEGDSSTGKSEKNDKSSRKHASRLGRVKGRSLMKSEELLPHNNKSKGEDSGEKAKLKPSLSMSVSVGTSQSADLGMTSERKSSSVFIETGDAGRSYSISLDEFNTGAEESSFTTDASSDSAGTPLVASKNESNGKKSGQKPDPIKKDKDVNGEKHPLKNLNHKPKKNFVPDETSGKHHSHSEKLLSDTRESSDKRGPRHSESVILDSASSFAHSEERQKVKPRRLEEKPPLPPKVNKLSATKSSEVKMRPNSERSSVVKNVKIEGENTCLIENAEGSGENSNLSSNCSDVFKASHCENRDSSSKVELIKSSNEDENAGRKIVKAFTKSGKQSVLRDDASDHNASDNSSSNSKATNDRSSNLR